MLLLRCQLRSLQRSCPLWRPARAAWTPLVLLLLLPQKLVLDVPDGHCYCRHCLCCERVLLPAAELLNCGMFHEPLLVLLLLQRVAAAAARSRIIAGVLVLDPAVSSLHEAALCVVAPTAASAMTVSCPKTCISHCLLPPFLHEV